MQAIGRFLACIDDALPKLFQFLVDLVPVILEFFENLLQCIGERSLQLWIVVKFNIKMVPDGVFDFGGLRLCS